MQRGTMLYTANPPVQIFGENNRLVTTVPNAGVQLGPFKNSQLTASGELIYLDYPGKVRYVRAHNATPNPSGVRPTPTPGPAPSPNQTPTPEQQANGLKFESWVHLNNKLAARTAAAWAPLERRYGMKWPQLIAAVTTNRITDTRTRNLIVQLGLISKRVQENQARNATIIQAVNSASPISYDAVTSIANYLGINLNGLGILPALGVLPTIVLIGISVYLLGLAWEQGRPREQDIRETIAAENNLTSLHSEALSYIEDPATRERLAKALAEATEKLVEAANKQGRNEQPGFFEGITNKIIWIGAGLLALKLVL